MTTDDAEILLRRLAPADLEGVPLYILSGDDVPKRLRAGDCCGYHNPATDIWAQPELEAARRWRGRGVALVSMLPTWHVLFETVVVHELAHALERPRRAGGIETLERHEFPEAMAALAIGPAQVETVEQEGLTRWHNHGIGWHRVLIHLAYRLSQLRGRTIGPAEFGAGRPYQVAAAETYRRALSTEPEDYIDGRLSMLTYTSPPQEFIDLWRRHTGEDWKPGT